MANLTNNNKLIDEINSKLKQVNVMPTADASNVWKVIQYIGPDDDVNNFFNWHFYRCISDGQDPATYSWEEIVLGVTSCNDLTDVEITNIQDWDTLIRDGESNKFVNVQDASKDSDIAFATINMTGREVIFNNEFITNTTLVNYTITNGWYPNGIIVASVDNGSLTIESSEEETNLQFFVKFEKVNSNSTILS